ncbi:L domain-like protein [Calocera cornea HHB12733]|uniref:L domain-like protein n=1 Tax=Calocera cornea HHB12733 TaxID=1353952 RepID=A0A165FLD6_9BASI|nr:L domain-like protein [Calocera cornea HHB12733]
MEDNTTPTDFVLVDPAHAHATAPNGQLPAHALPPPILNGAGGATGGTAHRAVVQLPEPEPEEESEEEEEEGVHDGTEQDFLADYPDDTEDLEVIHSRLTSTAPLRLPRFTHLKRLCLRQNVISALPEADFGTLTELEELDLYDNKVKELGEGLHHCTQLEVLDLSFNLLRAVPPTLAPFTTLKTLYLVQNKISRISHLAAVGRSLRSLELGGNRIRAIEALDALQGLEELWLGKNKITVLQGLDKLQNLRILSIQSNRITKLEGLDKLHNLEELYISHNGVERLEGLENNTKLRVLDVGNNRITTIENIAHLTQLEEFWANDNHIPTLADIEPQLAHLSALQTVYLEGNPCQKAEGAVYRRKVILALPQLQQLDATFVHAV